MVEPQQIVAPISKSFNRSRSVGSRRGPLLIGQTNQEEVVNLSSAIVSQNSWGPLQHTGVCLLKNVNFEPCVRSQKFQRLPLIYAEFNGAVGFSLVLWG